MKKILISAKEVAGMFSISRSTVYAYAYSGVLKPIYLPSTNVSQAKKRNRKAIRFRVDEVEKFLQDLLRMQGSGG